MRGWVISLLLAALALGEVLAQLIWFHIPVSSWLDLLSPLDKLILALEACAIAVVLFAAFGAPRPNSLGVLFAWLGLALGLLGAAYHAMGVVMLVQKLHVKLNPAVLGPATVPGGMSAGLGFLGLTLALFLNTAARGGATERSAAVRP